MTNDAPSAPGASPEPVMNRLVPWFGANVLNAEVPAMILKRCTYVSIPFYGGGAETPWFEKSVQILASDKHDELITLCKIVQDELKQNVLAHALAKKLFHPKEIEDAKAVLLRARPKKIAGGLFDAVPAADADAGPRPTELEIAEAFFVVAWMGRSGVAGTDGEEQVKLALRYDAGGGDNATRFFNAVESIEGWSKHMRRCMFTREDAFEVIDRLRQKISSPKFDRNEKGNRIGIYCDPPWVDAGDGYLHKFSIAEQRALAKELTTLPHVEVCMRFGDHPLVRELYPEKDWTWYRVKGRDMHNQGVAEVFLEKKP